MAEYSKLYELKEGDDIRIIRLRLTSDVQPDDALLIISGNGIRIERALTFDSATTDEWTYQWEDADFDDVTGNQTYKIEVYATFSDSSRNGTYPTRSTLSLKAYTRL